MSRTVEVWTNDPENKMVILSFAAAVKKRDKSDTGEVKGSDK